MDTIVLCRVYSMYEDASPYISLNNAPAPLGCKAWITSLKDSKSHVCWIKIQCHEIVGLHTQTSQDVDKLRAVVSGWLAFSGLELDDFLMSRIDYDYNFYLDPLTADALIDTMQRLSDRIQRMSKYNDPESVYYENKSRHVQFYPKDREREAKGYEVSADEKGLCRQEVQCFSGRIKYMRHEYGVLRDWDSWVSPQMENIYLAEAEPVFQSGDFYSLERAVDLIQSSDFSPCYKQRLTDALFIVQTQTMNALKKSYSRNTLKNYLAKLKELNISPLTIPSIYGIDCIPNPFWSAHTMGGAA